jgi:hypothetical protein
MSAQNPAVTGVTARYQGSYNTSFTTTFYYWVQALYTGGWAQLSVAGNTGAYCPSQTSPSSLVNVQWNPAPGAIGYLLFRTTTSTAPASLSTGIFIATSETGFKDDGSIATFTQTPRYDGVYVWSAVYDFATDGGAVGAIIPAISDTIPKGAVLFGGFINSPTAVTSGGAATISVGTSAGSGAATILAATGKASFSAEAVQEVLGTNSQAETNKPSFKMTAAGQINITVAAAALTAGIVEIFLTGIIPSNS